MSQSIFYSTRNFRNGIRKKLAAFLFCNYHFHVILNLQCYVDRHILLPMLNPTESIGIYLHMQPAIMHSIDLSGIRCRS